MTAPAKPLNQTDKPERVGCDVDFDAPGKQHGYLSVPYSSDTSAWGAITVPVTTIKGGDGPTVVFTGGNHGDEYEGQIALLKLAHQLLPEGLSGRVIILPCMNLPAVKAGRRTSPVDGANMNRIWPGDRDGGVTHQLADFISRHIVARADALIDIHSGGKTLDFVPSAVIHDLDDPDLMARTLAAMKAFGAPLGMVLKELDAEGMLDTLVEEQGKVFVSTELGGKGIATALTVGVAERGVRNMLAHFGLIDAEVEARDTRLMNTPDGSSFVQCRHQGLFEPLVDLGNPVTKGQPLANVHDFETSGAAPTVYEAPRDGLLYCRHAPGLIGRGDCMAVVAADYEPR